MRKNGAPSSSRSFTTRVVAKGNPQRDPRRPFPVFPLALAAASPAKVAQQVVPRPAETAVPPSPSPSASTYLNYFLYLFLVRLLGVSRQGELKNTINICVQKVYVENLFFSVKNCNVSFSSICFVLFLSNGSSRTKQKTFYKNRVKKLFQTNRQKNPIFILSRFLAFLGEGSPKTP
jgi:hypothetical protein